MHRVYINEGEVWTLAATYARRGPLPPDAAYVVLETEHPASVQTVCMLTDDGLRLCDIGPEHDHGD